MMRTVKVLCGECEAEMNIAEWGAYAFWFPSYDTSSDTIKDYPAPHANRGHPCKCGKYWLSSDGLDLVKDDENEIVYKFLECD